jgi:phytoene synthase
MVSPALADDLKSRDRERWLSVLWAPAAARQALVALHAYDLEQQRVVADARDPLLAEIRLAWWREQLEALSMGRAPPPQPLLQALAVDARARAVDLAGLTACEESFVLLLTEGGLDPLSLASARGKPLFTGLLTAILGRQLTSAEMADASAAGTRWALARLWRPGWGQAEPRLAGLKPPAFPPPARAVLPASLRVLDALAADDWSRLEAGCPLAAPASAGRQWRMLRAALRA